MLNKSIEELLLFASSHLDLKNEDVDYYRNLLLGKYNLDTPFEGKLDKAHIDSLKLPDEVFDSLVNDFIETGLNSHDAELEATYCFGLVSPAPSYVNTYCHSLINQGKAKEATDYLYNLSIENNYIAKSKVDKNIVFEANYKDGPSLDISINLSKPEKNNKDIAKLVGSKSAGYPKCLLCKENIGFKGNEKHPARENIRYIDLDLEGEKWFLQFSPYVYYLNHCIAFYEKHVFMEISPRIFRRLFDIVDIFPHYFIGSNSDLPIVGGSILNHEHFQGGAHIMPLMKANDRIVIKDENGLKISILDFYDSVIKLVSSSKEDILDAASKIEEAWRHYDNKELDIISYEGDIKHSTVTPIVRKVKDKYEMYIILRNNRCDEKYPTGIFHAHPEYAHIKHEGIGLIEAAGYFILPARLVRQSKEVEECIEKGLSNMEAIKLYPDLDIFTDMLDRMRNEKITSREYIADICRNILKNVAVFKDNELDMKEFKSFIEGALR